MSFAVRRRQNLRRSLRYSGALLGIACLVLALTVGPLHAGWWDTPLPAAIGSAIAALLIFAVAVNAPLEAIAYVALYTDRQLSLALPPRGFGRALYRQSGRLDALAREAGLPPLSDFGSPDPLDTHTAPTWHEPAAALPTVTHLLAHGSSMAPHLRYLSAALQSAQEQGARFYFLVLTWAGGTNARVEALRRGDLSVLATKAAPR